MPEPFTPEVVEMATSIISLALVITYIIFDMRRARTSRAEIAELRKEIEALKKS